MTDSSLSRTEINNKRQEKRNQRNGRLLLLFWRFLFLSSLAVGVSYFVSSPAWMLRNSEEIEVEGNQKLSKEEVRSWLPIKYPQKIWALPIGQLSKHLQDEPPLEMAKITREILPARLTVNVKERQPVAIANTSKGQGFLDDKGIWINRNFYPKDSNIGQGLTLNVVGFNDNHRSDWSKLYKQLPNSLVKIHSIDWSSPSNLILNTELGSVHCGTYNEKDFPQKILLLNKMKNLASRLPVERISYIDLSNPQKPTVQVIPETKEQDKPQEKKQ